jgi:hypothetical protein
MLLSIPVNTDEQGNVTVKCPFCGFNCFSMFDHDKQVQFNTCTHYDDYDNYFDAALFYSEN